ncbi:MAG: hypothetical protein HYV97_01995 [Bdellovibrio sp.]|nr:hypothetical protein [Bdellovibrio sp.]
MIIRAVTLLFLAGPIIPCAQADYWSDYKTCLSTIFTGDRAVCAELISSRQKTAVSKLATSLAGLSGGIPCTDTANNKVYLGNGFIVDRVSCGPRGENIPGCSSFFGPSTPSQDTSTVCASPLPATSGDGGAVIEWCFECAPDGCAACGSRGNMVDQAAKSVTNSVDKLLNCFKPGGRYPQPKMRSKIIKSYTELSASGTTLSCPNQDTSNASSGGLTAGRANLAERTIKVFPVGMGDTATFGHEFLHMCGNVDNQDVHTHNHPFNNHKHTGSGSGFSPATSTNQYGLPNQYFDRVYSCESLCFEKELISKEQCELCLEYGATNNSQKKLYKKPCQKMLTLEQLADLKKLQRYADEEIRDMCRFQTSQLFSQWNAPITQAISNIRSASVEIPDVYFINFRRTGAIELRTSISGMPQSGTTSTSLVGAKTPEQRETTPTELGGPVVTTDRAPTWSTVTSRCQNGIENAIDQLDSMITAETSRDDTSSNRNLSELRNTKRKYEMEKRIFEFKRICQRIKVYKMASTACLTAAGLSTEAAAHRGFCRNSFSLTSNSRYPEIKGALDSLKNNIVGNDSINGWNQFSSENSLAKIDAQGTPYSDQLYVPEAITMPASLDLNTASSLCNTLPSQATLITRVVGTLP